jgi:hypothetical protein
MINKIKNDDDQREKAVDTSTREGASFGRLSAKLKTKQSRKVSLVTESLQRLSVLVAMINKIKNDDDQREKAVDPSTREGASFGRLAPRAYRRFKQPEAHKGKQPEGKHPEVHKGKHPEAHKGKHPEVHKAKQPEADKAKQPETDKAKQPETDRLWVQRAQDQRVAGHTPREALKGAPGRRGW